MLKNLIRDSVCSKYSNVTYCCFRKFYQKMQNQEYRNPDANNFMRTSLNEEDNSSVQRDVLKNLRKWVPIDQTSKPGFIFTIFNYNILSQQLLESHSYLYQDSPRAALKWNNRLYNIVGEIFKTNPSILCCQVRKISHVNKNVLEIYFYIPNSSKLKKKSILLLIGSSMESSFANTKQIELHELCCPI